MVMSDFRLEVEIRPLRACAMRNMQYDPYLWQNCPNLRVFQEIVVEERDGDVRFQTGNGNTAVSRMRNASGHDYWNSLFIMDGAMGQIPCSTEHISSFIIKSYTEYNKAKAKNYIVPNYFTMQPSSFLDNIARVLHNLPRKLLSSVKLRGGQSYYAVQGHPRSPSLVPIESSYATSYQ